MVSSFSAGIESTCSDSVFETLPHRPIYHDLADFPSSSELSHSTRSLANGKAPGKSGILPKMLKHAGPIFHSALLALIHEAWRVGEVPQAWRNAELVTIPKRGDLSSCDNWRGITLLDVVGKALGCLLQNKLQVVAELLQNRLQVVAELLQNRLQVVAELLQNRLQVVAELLQNRLQVVAELLQNRLQVVAELELPETQCGFRRRCSCTDHIFTLLQSIEKFNKHQSSG